MAELVTNADDVELFINPRDGSQFRVKANEFSLSNEQTINSVGEIGKNQPKGLTKGDIEITYDFTIMGEDTDVMDAIKDRNGDSKPFDMTARKSADKGSDASWEYSLQLCLADTEEVSGTTGEAMELSVEGMAGGMDRLV